MSQSGLLCMQANAAPLLAALLLILTIMALRTLGSMFLLKPLLRPIYRVVKALFPSLVNRGGAALPTRSSSSKPPPCRTRVSHTLILTAPAHGTTQLKRR